MIEIVSESRSHPLRVAVSHRAAASRERLIRMLSGLGHIAVESGQMADVILCEDPRRAAGGPFLLVQRTDGASASSLPADLDSAQLGAALWAVYVGLSVQARESDGFARLGDTETRPLLTPREIEILEAISQGHSNKAIARKLEISLHTVKFHIESVFRKLGARNRTEAVAKARERFRDEIVSL